MADEHDHGAYVNAWMERVARGLPPEQLLRAFERGFAALWQRARQTLGDVTLTAIGDRVLYTAMERFSVLASLELQAAGISCEALLASAGHLDREQLVEGIRFVMTELLTVLGNLTAEILTPALHVELAKIVPSELGTPAHGSEGTEP